MNETYCIKDKRVTPCVEPSGYQTDNKSPLRGHVVTDISRELC